MGQLHPIKNQTNKKKNKNKFFMQKGQTIVGEIKILYQISTLELTMGQIRDLEVSKVPP